MKVSIKQYSQSLLELTDGKSEQDVLDTVKNFALQLKKDGQLKNTIRIMEKFSELYNEAHGIVVAQVVVRKDVSNDMIENVKEFVKKKYNAKEVEMEVVIDEKIQGGIIVKVGDEILDGSVAAQLKKLKNILSK